MRRLSLVLALAVTAVARSAEGLAGTVEAIRAAGGTVEPFPGSVASAEEVDRIVGEVEARFGAVHVLVNNAGITRDGLLLRMEDDAFRAVVETNLFGPFYFTRAVGMLMMRQRYGRIVNITSVSGLMGNPGQANYSASKAGVIGFTQTIAKELASRKITVNAVAPGFITTDMTAVLGEVFKDEAKKRIPAKRIGQVNDVAECVLFLASPAAAYITGQVIAIDGGMSVGMTASA